MAYLVLAWEGFILACVDLSVNVASSKVAATIG